MRRCDNVKQRKKSVMPQLNVGFQEKRKKTKQQSKQSQKKS